MRTKFSAVAVVVSLCVGLVGAVVTSCQTGTAVSAPDDPIVQNLRAFAKLYGYVRYFHPTDRASAIDWERFAVLGAARIQEAGSSETLRAILDSLFLPIAPTVQLYDEHEPAPEPPSGLIPSDTTGHRLVYWQHRGVGLGNPGRYRSIRVNRPDPEKPVPSAASFWKRIDASPFRGKEIRLTVAVKAEVSDPASQAQVLLYDELPDLKNQFVADTHEHPITVNEWDAHSLSGRVSLEADTIGFGGTLVGSGSAWFDDFRLEVRAEGGEAWTPVRLPNAGFEEAAPGGAPAGWRTWANGYQTQTDASTWTEGSSSLRLQFNNSPTLARPMFDRAPAPGEVFRRSLGAGLAVQVPLALYSIDGRTLDAPDAMSASVLEMELSKLDSTSFSPEFDSVRLADVIILWNVIQHFHPLLDTASADWDDVLTRALVRARQDASAEDFLETLRWMVAQLDDGHGFVEHPVAQNEARPPFLLDEAEGQFVIAAVAPGQYGSCFRQGDLVLSIDGRPIDGALDAAMEMIAGSPQWKRQRALREFGLGERGTAVRLKLKRDREEIDCDAVRSYSAGIWPDRPKSFDPVADGVYYVNLSTAPMEAIDAQIATLASAEAVIFDLRGYTRGNLGVLSYLSDEPLRSTYWPIPQVIYPDRENLVGYDSTGRRWQLPPRSPRIRGRVVFLADANAISQAESVLGIVEHYGLGEIVGQRTAGVTGDANPLTLPGGYRVTWTGMRVQKHDGALHHGAGIAPTVPVAKTVDGLVSGRDEVLERALQLVQEP